MLQALPATIAAYHAAYAAGLCPADAMTAVLTRLAAINDPGLFLHLATREELLAQLATMPPFDVAVMPLWGIPFAVKDNIDVAAMPTTAACPAFAYTPKQDAEAVARLRAAGAIPIGKTNLDQFATGLVGIRTPHPAPINAKAPSMVPGGSSAGSAVAVGHGVVPFALGTDTAGSGRVPAALNDIVGLKPSLGSVSARGMVPACRSLDTISVFATTVADAHAVYRTIGGYDADDPFARSRPVRPVAACPAALRIGVPDDASRRFFGDAAQEAAFDAALAQLKDLGATLVPVDLTPFNAVAAMLYAGPWLAERFAAVESLILGQPDALHPVTRQVIERAANFTAVSTFQAYYRLRDLQLVTERAMADVDVLCVPTIPTPCTLADVAADPIGANSQLGTYTNYVNLLDMCALAIPLGARTDGLPGGGITLIGPGGQDHRLAGIAAKALGEPSASPVPAIQPDELAVALVGAHMSGLPLNFQLTERGGRFLRATQSAPDYRLYALPGGPPSRPGMVRVADGGVALALEVWALPLETVGSFLAGIPAPLGLGKTKLADGSLVTGFMCEAAGTAGAEDISHFGGWRAYIASLK